MLAISGRLGHIHGGADRSVYSAAEWLKAYDRPCILLRLSFEPVVIAWTAAQQDACNDCFERIRRFTAHKAVHAARGIDTHGLATGADRRQQ